jgi:hypothetical protein
MAGLATEGGLYYLTGRNAQNTADAAAMSAASAYQYRGGTASVAAAMEVAALNGFPASTVTVNHPPSSGPNAGNNYAFEVKISKTMPLYLSRVFQDRSTIDISARAVSLLQGNTSGCILALTGSVTIQNSSTFNAANCAVGSNAPGVGISIPASNGAVIIQTVIAVGTCSGCNNPRWSFSQGYKEHSPPMSNPYDYLDSKSHPTVNGASCLNTTTLNANGPIAATGATKAYCANVTVSNTSAVVLQPGTYIFQNASVTISNIASFACTGCSFIFTGSNPGTLNINNTSSVNMSARAVNNDDADYDGLLFHRVKSGITGSSASPTLNLSNVASFNLSGGIYYPQAYVKIDNMSSTMQSGCLALVVGTVAVNNFNNYRFDVSNCATFGTTVPTTQTPRLVE